jgi:hypothetical protein
MMLAPFALTPFTLTLAFAPFMLVPVAAIMPSIMVVIGESGGRDAAHQTDGDDCGKQGFHHDQAP